MQASAPISQQNDDSLSCRESIAKGSLSFSLASQVLTKRDRGAIYALYAWCRHCDNAVDELPKSISDEEKRAVIADLKANTNSAINGRYQGRDFVFRSLQEMTKAFSIPSAYFQDLIDGMEMDTLQTRYQSMDDLRLYCYRVAGVVGIIFAHIVGVRTPKALDQAVALGMAMQLTNIARDVAADQALGRTYLPGLWLMSAGVDGDSILAEENRPKVWAVVKDLLAEADSYYRQAEAGMIALPWRAALAAQAARNIYSAIGYKILRIGPNYLSFRTCISGPQKLFLLGKACWQIARQIPARLRNPFKPCNISTIWRYE